MTDLLARASDALYDAVLAHDQVTIAAILVVVIGCAAIMLGGAHALIELTLGRIRWR